MRIIFGLLLLPITVGVARTFVFLMRRLAEGAPNAANSALFIGSGFAGWLIVMLFLPKPTRLYVLAHELSHAIWGAAFGARISGIRVSKSGGSVKLSKHNPVAALAPYFFPFYTVLTIFLYVALSLFMDMRPFRSAWLALIGFTLGFHFWFTADALSRRQPDLNEYGIVFSYSLIIFLCLLELTVLAAIVVPDVGALTFANRLATDVFEVWSWCWSFSVDGASKLAIRCQLAR